MIGVGTTIFLVRPQTFASPVSYLLDTYSAAAAYSLRQLKTGVTNVVRVRRSSDSAESDFTAGEITDGTLTTWTGANDGFVVTWYDQSGNSNDATQGTAASQPQLVTAGVVNTKGSLPCITFDGTNDYLSKTTATGLSTTDISISAVYAAAATETVGHLVSTSDLNSSLSRTAIRVYADSRSTNKVNLYVQNSISSTFFTEYSTFLNDTNQHLLFNAIDSSKNMSSFNDSNTGTTNTYTGSTRADAVLIGAWNYNTAQYISFFQGDYQELVIYSVDESANRTGIETNTNDYYSIY